MCECIIFDHTVITDFVFRNEADGKRYIKYQVIGINEVAVPTHFFKVIVMESENGEYHLKSFVMPNAVIDDAVPLHAFYVCNNNFIHSYKNNQLLQGSFALLIFFYLLVSFSNNSQFRLIEKIISCSFSNMVVYNVIIFFYGDK